jgi:hypothetical protein
MLAESVRVLLVEDNMGDALLIHEGLEDALPGQFHVSHVRQLSEALEYLWKEIFQVVLLDLVSLARKLALNSRGMFSEPLPHLVVRPRPLEWVGIAMIVFRP